MARTAEPQRKRAHTLPADPYASAKIAGLRYVQAEGPGIVRKRAGSGFVYIGVDGTPVRDPEELKQFGR